MLNRPLTPSSSPNLLNVYDGASSFNAATSQFSASSPRTSNFTLKIKELSLDNLVPTSNNNEDFARYLKINIEEVYKTTGLPTVSKKANQAEMHIFMV